MRLLLAAAWTATLSLSNCTPCRLRDGSELDQGQNSLIFMLRRYDPDLFEGSGPRAEIYFASFYEQEAIELTCRRTTRHDNRRVIGGINIEGPSLVRLPA